MPVTIHEIESQVRETNPAAPLSPEMIRLIADKVIAMLLNDLRIEAERSHRDRQFGERVPKGRR
jgi:hypothetical protein